jgi:hypothetical protein
MNSTRAGNVRSAMTLMLISTLRESPSNQQIGVRQLAGRECVFTNVPPGEAYVVAPSGGWLFDRIGAPVRCQPSGTHRLDLRLRGLPLNSERNVSTGS